MLAVKFPKDIEKRLEDLERRTGEAKASHVRRAVSDYLDDLEDAELAERALRDDDGTRFSLQDIKDDLKLDETRSD